MEAMDAVGTVAPHADLSIWALFWQADIVVKSVMIGLLVASVWCWAIIVDKSMLYGRAQGRDEQVRAGVLVGPVARGSLPADGGAPIHGAGAVFVAAMKEWKRSHEQNASSFVGVQGRLDKVLDVAISREARRWRSGSASSPRSARHRPSLAFLARYGAS